MKKLKQRGASWVGHFLIHEGWSNINKGTLIEGRNVGAETILNYTGQIKKEVRCDFYWKLNILT